MSDSHVASASAAAPTPTAGLTESEAKVYDRQLRLWGVEVQKRLMAATVLVVGLSGIHVEVCKNLLLGGISLSVADDREVSEVELRRNFFLRSGDVGSRVGPSAVARMAEMNPLVRVVAVDDAGRLVDLLRNCDAKVEEVATLLRRYTAVCVAIEDIPLHNLAEFDALCRREGVGFFASLCCGRSGMFFSDMGKHTISDTASFDFPSLAAFMACGADDLNWRRTEPTLFAFLGVCRWQAAGGEEELSQVTRRFLEDSSGMDEERRRQIVCIAAELQRTYCCNLVTTAAVMGGLLSQELRKFISKQEAPLVNSVCFAADSSSGTYACVPPAK